VLLGLLATPALGATPRVSLTDIEDQVMCTSCHEPLAVSQSPQGNAERDLIRSLIARGDSKQQILNELVAQYGPAVLALPRAHGFNLLVYILPPALLVIGLGALAYTLPRWRRRAREAVPEGGAGAPQLDPDDARRLDDDLARYGR
jgi:cytochrome c-type biogenesis protein CcmH